MGAGGTAHGQMQVALSCLRSLGLGFGSATAGRASESGGAQRGPRGVERLFRGSTIHKRGRKCAAASGAGKTAAPPRIYRVLTARAGAGSPRKRVGQTHGYGVRLVRAGFARVCCGLTAGFPGMAQNHEVLRAGDVVPAQVPQGALQRAFQRAPQDHVRRAVAGAAQQIRGTARIISRWPSLPATVVT